MLETVPVITRSAAVLHWTGDAFAITDFSPTAESSQNGKRLLQVWRDRLVLYAGLTSCSRLSWGLVAYSERLIQKLIQKLPALAILSDLA